MKKIVVFGASSSSKSINKKLSIYAAGQFKDHEIIVLDLNDYEMPIYSEDKEIKIGIPNEAHNFYSTLKDSDGIIISFAEHNGSYSVAFKNIFDWVSRIGKIVWWNKPMLLLSTSEGNRGASSVLKIAHQRISYNHSYKIPTFSLPSFSKNFDVINGIIDEDLKKDFVKACDIFKLNLSS